MIKLFKRIRKRSLSKKTRKSFSFMVIEVSLVVIGVIIALAFDNYNDKRKQENVFRSNLILANQELNINIVTKAILNYQEKDSLSGSVMSDTLELEDYKLGKGFDLTYILFWVAQINTFNNSFNTLNQNLGGLPNKYGKALRLLDNVYSRHRNEFVKWNQIMMDEVIQNELKISDSQEWYSSYLWNMEVKEGGYKLFFKRSILQKPSSSLL